MHATQRCTLRIHGLDHFVFSDHLRNHCIIRRAHKLVLKVEVLHFALHVYLPLHCHVLEVIPVLRVEIVTAFEEHALHLNFPPIFFDHVSRALRFFLLVGFAPLNLLLQQFLLLGLFLQQCLLNPVLLKHFLILDLL